MAHSETVGWGACSHCGGQVAIKSNRSGLAYSRCDHCGVEIRHHWHKTSDAVLRQFAKPAPVEKQAEDPAKRGDSPPAEVRKAAPKSIISTLLG